MTTSTIIILVLCCLILPMGAYVTMNSKKKNNVDSSDKNTDSTENR